MSEISVLNFDKQEVNSLLAGTFGVPGVTADSSLADLSTNIGLIDTDPHPDYALPWIMADGSSAFVVPVTMGRNRGADVNVSLVPHPDNAGAIVMATMTGGAQWGLNQMTAGMRARYRMDASPGNTPDANNNYAGLNNVWSDSSCPYWHKMKFAVSHYDNDYRCSLYQAGSWTHAASSMSQASTSSFNSLPIAVFGSSYVYTNKVAMRPNGTNKYFASKGTMLYDLTFTTGTYDSSTIGDTYTPVLHWDRVYKKYRPCLYESTSGKYSSFAIGEGNNFPDDGRDGAYYIDRASGLEYLGATASGTIYSNIMITTDIPYERDNQLIVYFGIGSYTSYSGDTNVRELVKATGSNVSTLPLIAASKTYLGSSTRDYIWTYDLAQGGDRIYSSNYMADVVGYDYSAKNKSYYVRSVNNAGINYITKTFGTTSTPGTSSTSGYFYQINAKCVSYMWIVNSNNEVTHYLTTCTYNGNTVIYDVITKKIYS